MKSRGAILSVGGSPQPIVKALTLEQVEYALFVASEKSAVAIMEDILPALGYVPQWEVHMLASPDDLSACYQSIRTAIGDWLSRRRLSANEVYFDFTGGTKPMSAALTLAAVERIPRYHYVSGDREKHGLGTVITGTERPVAGRNPLHEAAVRQRELATRLYASGQVDAASIVLKEAAELAPDQAETLEAYARLCDLLAKLDRFEFRGRPNDLGQIKARLRVAFEHRSARELIGWLDAFETHLRAIDFESRAQKDHPHSLLELLANARRRARQGRYDDAIARLYRAVELFAQNKLHGAFGAVSGRIRLPELSPEPADRLAEALPDCVLDETLTLSSAKAFAALGLSPRPEDRALSGIYDRLRPGLEKRNNSWLAHGTRAATQGDFDELWGQVVDALGIAEADLPEWPALAFDS